MDKINRQFLQFCNVMPKGIRMLSGSNNNNHEPKWDDLFDWLVSHKNYDAKAFWSQLDDDGNYFFTTILRKQPSIAHEIYDFWLKEIKGYEDDFFNHKNKHGHCLLNVAWHTYIDLYESSREGYSSYIFDSTPLPNLLSRISKRTNDDNFTWLDKNNNNKASGIVNELISFLSKSVHEEKIQKFLNSIIERFPQDKSSAKYSWSKVKTSEQILAMLNTGFSIEDKVEIRNQSMPAWKWVTLQSYNDKNAMHLIDNNINKESWGDFKELQKNIDYWRKDSGLVAKDYREKIGYVRRVLKTTSTDPWGRNSLDYLLLSRPDLLPLLINELHEKPFTKKEFKDRFLKPDLLGYGFLNRAFVRLQKNTLNELLSFLQKNDLPVEFGFEQKGLLKDYIENKSWHKTASSLNNNNYNNNKNFHLNPSSVFSLSSIDAKLIFGNDDVQKEWVGFWNNYFSLLKDEYTKGNVNARNIPTSFKKYASIQLYASLAHNSNKNWGEDLNKTLLSQLRLASFIFAANTELMTHGVFSSFGFASSQYPEIYTNQMQELIHVIPKLSNPEDIGNYSKRDIPCIKNEIVADLSKKLLKSEIGSKSEAKRKSRIKIM